ncbi:invasion associated locus B family protein [Paracoccus ravus]|uniref:invasion associated locus B family protein n=1 Tax=Paracoccus ravus TaxID=2447760 RepID=UPI00106DF470|nr:invasion associated locus B family protein [Paracoccus ravus]
MLYSVSRVAGAAALIAAALTTPVLAQDSIGNSGSWTAFSASSPKECWAVSAPVESRNTDADGNPKEVTRGDIRLYVTYRPGQAGEVSFAGGYPFASGSTVELNVGGQVFKLFTEGESAWAESPAADGKLISALRAGSSATVSGQSGRGTVTKDSFSLSGITAMTNKAQSACK